VQAKEAQPETPRGYLQLRTYCGARLLGKTSEADDFALEFGFPPDYEYGADTDQYVLENKPLVPSLPDNVHSQSNSLLLNDTAQGWLTIFRDDEIHFEFWIQTCHCSYSPVKRM
jgi:hypothetical protein